MCPTVSLGSHSQKQLAQWAVDVTAHVYACWLSSWLRCNFSAADVQSNTTYAAFSTIWVSFALNECPPLIVSKDGKLSAATLKWNLYPQREYQFWECRRDIYLPTWANYHTCAGGLQWPKSIFPRHCMSYLDRCNVQCAIAIRIPHPHKGPITILGENCPRSNPDTAHMEYTCFNCARLSLISCIFQLNWKSQYSKLKMEFHFHSVNQSGERMDFQLL